MKKCSICDIVLSNIAEYNTQSKTKIDRCIGCENIEDEIKDLCVCGNIIYNNLSYYKQNGNMCKKCISKVNHIIYLKNELNWLLDLRKNIKKEIENRLFNEKIDKQKLNIKKRPLMIKLNSFTLEWLKEKLIGDTIEQDIESKKIEIKLAYEL